MESGWDVEAVLAASKGSLLAGGMGASFGSICTDTRVLQPGDLFVALVGDNFDGHEFAAASVKKGAAGLVVSRPLEALSNVPVILVPDTLRALGDMAAFRRSAMPDLKVVAITGSSGKTTVKEMTAAILEQNHKILKTQGNFNNLVGLPLSLLPVAPAHQFAVLEMGMNRPGEIGRLAEIAAPDVACILNVQESHLEGLGDIDGVAHGKGELFAGLGPEAVMAVNLDDPRVCEQARKYPNRQVTFGCATAATVRATHIRNLAEEGMAFTLHVGDRKKRVAIRQPGIHNVGNSLAAAAMSHALGVEINEIASGLEIFSSYGNRLGIMELDNGLKVINDTYNANPASVKAALKTLQGVAGGGKKVVALGDMLEMGSHSAAAHRSVGEAVADIDCDLLLVVGGFGRKTLDGARAAGMEKQNAREFSSKEEMATYLKKLVVLGDLTAGDWLLVKGSRGMRMEILVEELAKPF